MIHSLKNLILLIVAILVLCILAFFVGKSYTSKQSKLSVDTSRESVIQQIESLNRLETASYTIEKVIEAGTQGNQFQQILYGDKILLIAHGKVVAGVDLSQVGSQQISVNGTRVTATLPATTIFSSSLDNTQTKVFDRKLGFLSRGNQDLESLARASAETSISQAACEGGILSEAATNAKTRLTELLRSLGFTDITVTVPAGTCSN